MFLWSVTSASVTLAGLSVLWVLMLPYIFPGLELWGVMYGFHLSFSTFFLCYFRIQLLIWMSLFLLEYSSFSLPPVGHAKYTPLYRAKKNKHQKFGTIYWKHRKGHIWDSSSEKCSTEHIERRKTSNKRN